MLNKPDYSGTSEAWWSPEIGLHLPRRAHITLDPVDFLQCTSGASGILGECFCSTVGQVGWSFLKVLDTVIVVNHGPETMQKVVQG